MKQTKQTTIEQKIGELIRDITKAGFMPKSEVRRRIQEIIEVTIQAMLVGDEEWRYPLRHILQKYFYLDDLRDKWWREDQIINQCCALQKEKAKLINPQERGREDI